MKLFVWSKITQTKIYLTVAVQTRQELAQYLENEWFVFSGVSDTNSYHINEVFAEYPVQKSFVSSVTGGGIGIIGGPVGVFFGAVVGYYVGSVDSRRADKFNAS